MIWRCGCNVVYLTLLNIILSFFFRDSRAWLKETAECARKTDVSAEFNTTEQMFVLSSHGMLRLTLSSPPSRVSAYWTWHTYYWPTIPLSTWCIISLKNLLHFWHTLFNGSTGRKNGNFHQHILPGNMHTWVILVCVRTCRIGTNIVARLCSSKPNWTKF